jgi:hypothetical protein
LCVKHLTTDCVVGTKEMRRLGDSIEATVYDLQLDGAAPQRVIARDIDREPGGGH